VECARGLTASEAKTFLHGRLVEFQRRSAGLETALSEQKTAFQARQETLLLRLIEIVDALENLDETIRTREAELDKPARRLARSVGLIHRKLQRLLEDSDVVPIELHDGLACMDTCKVVGTRLAEGRPDRTVLDVVRRGYRISGRVLRKAEVVTVRND